MALLMQGCQKAPDATKTTEMVDTNAPIAPTFVETTNIAPIVPQTNFAVTPETSAPPTMVQTSPPPVVTEPLPLDTQPQTPPPSQVTQHKIVAGDTLGKLARYYKVSVKAIEAANPGIDSTRLKIDQIVQIPAPAPPSPSVALSSFTAEPPANGTRTYKVKSGDTLIRIASQHGVTVKALRAANGLRTDRIRVDQVLKIPAKNGGSGTGSQADAASLGTTSTPPQSGLGNP